MYTLCKLERSTFSAFISCFALRSVIYKLQFHPSHSRSRAVVLGVVGFSVECFSFCLLGILLHAKNSLDVLLPFHTKWHAANSV